MLQWPRDADRLPNGNTLITDTAGNRVIEVGPDGDLVWGVEIKGGYEAERLGTGDESRGGKQARALQSAESRDTERFDDLPPQVRLAINGLLFVLPAWADLLTVLGIVSVILGSIGLIVTEVVRILRLRMIVE